MMAQNNPETDWQTVVSDFHNKTDRATAVLGAAYLEAHLGQLIASFFIEESGVAESLLDVERPLGTFSARARAAYCMGLISANEYYDLNLIMQIQYAFSNQVSEVAFTDDGIREKCFMLRIPREVLLPGESHTPRQLFVFATAMLTQHLAWRSVEAESKRCIAPDDFMLVDLDE
jgi:DNA-binding MltR family transcriptional regulator